jgi:hypothetical protein
MACGARRSVDPSRDTWLLELRTMKGRFVLALSDSNAALSVVSGDYDTVAVPGSKPARSIIVVGPW